MNRKRMIIALCVVTVATSALAIGRNSIGGSNAAVVKARNGAGKTHAPGNAATAQSSASFTPQQANVPQQAGAPQTPGQPAVNVPQYIIYRQLFRHVVMLKKRAEEEERNGRDGAALRGLYKRNAQLNDAQAAILDQIATENDRQVAELDAQAQKIIADARAQHPRGQLAPGEQLPPPPAELASLQEQRNTVVLQARDQLRGLFGEAEFDRFDRYVQRDVAPKIKPVQLGVPRPVLPGSPRPQKK